MNIAFHFVDGGFPSNLQTGKAITLLNLASLCCIKKDLERARKCLYQAVALFGSEIPSQAVLLSAYIELQSGSLPAALQIIKRHQPIPLHKVGERKRGRK